MKISTFCATSANVSSDFDRVSPCDRIPGFTRTIVAVEATGLGEVPGEAFSLPLV